MKRTLSLALRAGLIALATVVTGAGVATPSLAQEHHWRRDRDWHGHWRHHDWDRGDAYVGPSYGYYDYGYPPPPVVYPQPGFSINIPLDIH